MSELKDEVMFEYRQKKIIQRIIKKQNQYMLFLGKRINGCGQNAKTFMSDGFY